MHGFPRYALSCTATVTRPIEVDIIRWIFERNFESCFITVCRNMQIASKMDSFRGNNPFLIFIRTCGLDNKNIMARHPVFETHVWKLMYILHYDDNRQL